MVGLCRFGPRGGPHGRASLALATGFRALISQLFLDLGERRVGQRGAIGKYYGRDRLVPVIRLLDDFGCLGLFLDIDFFEHDALAAPLTFPPAPLTAQGRTATRRPA